MSETPGMLSCVACKAALSLQALQPGGRVACPMCLAPLELTFYPAFGRTLASERGEAIEEGADSACFFHAEKKAAAACGACGRFLCGLCAIDFAGETRCASCLESGKKKGKMIELDEQRTMYDSIVLALALVAVIPFFTWFATPLALFLVLWYWKKPGSLFRTNRWRFVLAAAIASLQLLAIVWFFYSVIKGLRK